jgi:hypothetical protein
MTRRQKIALVEIVLGLISFALLIPLMRARTWLMLVAMLVFGIAVYGIRAWTRRKRHEKDIGSEPGR